MKYDPADIPILIGTFLFGTSGGLILTVLVSVIQGLFISGDGGPNRRFNAYPGNW